VLRHRIIPGVTALTLSALVVTGVGTATADPGIEATRAEVAKDILNDSGTSLMKSHVGGQNHPASTAHQNVADTAAGKAATTSPWSDVGEKSVNLSVNMLTGMKQLGGSYDFRVTTVAGGDHSSNSFHYKGTAFDVDQINGKEVNSSNPHYKDFMNKCQYLGATEILGPGDEGHATHVHCAWSQ
jgi:hypothetical protein